jgi:hypothetical protein
MSLFCEVSGRRVVSGSICILALGVWYADLLLDQPSSVVGAQTISLGPLQMQGTSVIQGTFTGSTRCRILAGKAGWRESVAAKSYQHDLGVKKSTVIGDVAKAVGETAIVSTDGIVGTAFVRQSGPAARVLNQVGDFWYVRADGVTVVGPRPSSLIMTAFDVMSAQLAVGQLVVATENPEDWTPGRKFSTPTISERTLSAVMHKIDKDAVRTEAWVL